MADIGEAEVRAIADAAGFVLSPDDLAEVTIRMNAFIEGFEALDGLVLTEVEVFPALPHPEQLP